MIKLILHLIFGDWTKWKLVYIYNYSSSNYSIEVRQSLDDGRLQWRVKKIAYPVYGKHFNVEDVNKVLENI